MQYLLYYPQLPIYKLTTPLHPDNKKVINALKYIFIFQDFGLNFFWFDCIINYLTNDYRKLQHKRLGAVLWFKFKSLKEIQKVWLDKFWGIVFLKIDKKGADQNGDGGEAKGFGGSTALINQVVHSQIHCPKFQKTWEDFQKEAWCRCKGGENPTKSPKCSNLNSPH